MWVYTFQDKRLPSNINSPTFTHQTNTQRQCRLSDKKKTSKPAHKIKKYYLGKKVNTQTNTTEYTINQHKYNDNITTIKNNCKKRVLNKQGKCMKKQIQGKRDKSNKSQLTNRLESCRECGNDEIDWSRINNVSLDYPKQNKKLFINYQIEPSKLVKKGLRENKNKELLMRKEKNQMRKYHKTETFEKQSIFKDIFANKLIKNLNLWERVDGEESVDEKQRTVMKKGERKKENKLKMSKNEFCSMKITSADQLYIMKMIGEGTFGKVYKGMIKSNRKEVAIKKVFDDKNYKNRQIEILKMMNSEYVIKMLSHFTTYEEKNGKVQEYINIVTDYHPFNFYEHIKNRRYKMQPLEVKIYIYQLFRGLLYLHSLNICHRDIKPHNLLINNGKLLICDMGSAKFLKKGQKNISYICSRCYRAPELIFGSVFYSIMIDIWSAGCVILQIINKKPLFIAKNSIEHLVQIIKILGTPTNTDIHGMNSDFNIEEFDVPEVKKKPWQEVRFEDKQVFPECDQKLIDLIQKIIVYNPDKRLSAAEVLGHGYFDELRQKSVYTNIEKKIQGVDFFNFNESNQFQIKSN